MDNFPRWSRGRFFVVWAAITLPQLYAFVQGMQTIGEPSISTVAWLSGVFLLQLLKLPPTQRRLQDLGRDPAEALLALVPLANIGLFFQRALRRTPSVDLWERRQARWRSVAGEDTLWTYLSGGMSLLPGVLLSILPAFVVVVGLRVLVDYGIQGFVAQLPELDASLKSNLRTAMLALSGLLGLYVILNIPKRADASRASWVPALLLPSALLVAIGLSLDPAHPAVAACLFYAGDFLTRTLLNGVLLAVVIAAGAAVAEGRSTGDAVREVLGRTWGIIAVHGGKALAVSLGLQVVIPGIYYAIRMALVEHAVVLEPSRRAFARSRELVAGMRTRVFALLWIGFVVEMILFVAIAVAIEGPRQLVANQLAPAWQLPTLVLSWLSTYAVWVVGALVFLQLYRSRAARMDDRDAA